MRDLGALLALPAMWVDHQPVEIANGLLSVLFGILQLDGAYARFDDPWGGGRALETWRPSGPRAPAELLLVLEADETPAPGITTTQVDLQELGTFQVTSLPLALPWETGLVIVSSDRSDFPTAMETHLLRIAVGQAAIAIHTARRLAREHAARSTAEAALRRQNELLRSLVDDVEPSLTSIFRRIQDAAQLISEVDASRGRGEPEVGPAGPSAPSGGADSARLRSPLLRLTPREMEVLGLLAQGLSNKEIAGLMWLSDRTVERHITSLYRKIGVARRSEATAFALRHGVI
jgi:DNA-binding CsgD family transcriptional regulator